MDMTAWDLLAKKDLTLEELAERYPDRWQSAQKEVCRVLASREPQQIKDYALSVQKKTLFWRKRIQSSGRNPQVMKAALPNLVHSRLSHLALNKFLDAAQNKSKEEKSNFIEWIMPDAKWLFRRHLSPGRNEIPPLRLSRIGWAWRFVRNKSRLLGRAYREGVYCAFTYEFIQCLSQILGNKNVLEVAAGDGSLSRALRPACQITATDDYSWKSRIQIPSDVENLDAISAIKKYQPEVVLCSFPPAPNQFENYILNQSQIQTYIVIGSIHDYASGDHKAYRQCKNHSWSTNRHLSALLFPKEVEAVVYRFERLSKAIST